MTITAIVLSIVFSVITIGCFIGVDVGIEINVIDDPDKWWICRVITSILCVIGIVLIFYGFHWYCNNTESGKRAMKSQEINFNNNIEREVKVYDINGELVESYRGRFDVSYTDERIMFDDEQGHRHIIYFKTGMVTVNDVQEVPNANNS